MECQFKNDIVVNDETVFCEDERVEVVLKGHVCQLPAGSYISLTDSNQMVRLNELRLVKPYDRQTQKEIPELLNQVRTAKKILLVDKSAGDVNHVKWSGDYYYFFPGETMESAHDGVSEIIMAKRILTYDLVKETAEKAKIHIYEVSYDERFPGLYCLSYCGRSKHPVYMGDTMEDVIKCFSKQ